LAKYQAIAAMASRFRYKGFMYELATLQALGKTYHPIYLDSTIDIASSIARQVLEKKISAEAGQLRLSLLRDTHPIAQPIIREVVQVITASHQPEVTEKLIRIIRTREVIHALLRLEAILTMVKNPKFGGEENRERVRRELDSLEELLGDNELDISRITMVRAKLGFHSDFLPQG
jgi:hypothetical protein